MIKTAVRPPQTMSSVVIMSIKGDHLCFATGRAQATPLPLAPQADLSKLYARFLRRIQHYFKLCGNGTLTPPTQDTASTQLATWRQPETSNLKAIKSVSRDDIINTDHPRRVEAHGHYHHTDNAECRDPCKGPGQFDPNGREQGEGDYGAAKPGSRRPSHRCCGRRLLRLFLLHVL